MKNGIAGISHWAGRIIQPVWLSVIYVLSFLMIGVVLKSSNAPAQDAQETDTPSALHAEFVGSSTCASCHAAEHSEWRSSQHHDAMQVADDKTVLGDFGGAKFSKDGIESTFFKKDGKFWVRTDGPDGTLADFEIRYTFGIAPLQQYLLELPGGRMQALGIAWDARSKEQGGQRWYHLYPNRKLVAGDPLHWTAIDQNWNYQCAWCHSTNLQKGYEPATGQFKTTWSEMSVGCEACHGPASNHIVWAQEHKGANKAAEIGAPNEQPGKGFAQRFDERKGVSWPMADGRQAIRSTPRSSSKEINACAQCHARRQQFSDDSLAVGRFLDAFRPSYLAEGLYHADGQQRDEVYTYASFLQSKMHAAGVTCSDCHNPHSGKLRASGNAVCATCHAAAKFDAPEHHHHASGSKGAACVSCHMPATTYMGIDPRHDHSMRIPRPDRSVILATPNACTQCHTDKNPTWAQAAIKSWYPAPKPGAQDFAEAFDLGDRMAPGAQAALLRIAQEGTGSAIARASAIARLGRFPSQQSLDLSVQSLAADDAAVRAAAVAIVAGADATTRIAALAPLLRDPSRLVRMDTARALAGDAAGLAPGDRAALKSALDEYVAGQNFNAERPESQVNLGNLFRDQGNGDAARTSLKKAIERDGSFVEARISLSDLERAQGNEAAAEKVLREAEAVDPDSAPVAHALGLSLVRQKRTGEAIAMLRKAVEKGPEDPRFAYVLGVALHDTGNAKEAIATLKEALARNHYNRDILFALAQYEAEIQDFGSALQRAELLARLEPNNPQVLQLVGSLRQRGRD